MGNDDDEDERQVQISFTTNLGDELRVSSAPIVVPARLSRQGLSEVINHLLGLSKHRPFDFLVAGTLLRSSLTKLIASKGLSEEDVVEVEYFLISDAPKEDQDKPHRDWVSAVSGSGQGHMASGCYDKIARMFPPGAKEEDAVELHGHTEAVTSVSLSDDGAKLASGSLDHTVRAWCIGGGHARLEGHAAGVSCVEVYKERIISGSADKTLKLWALPTHDEVTGSGGESKKVSKGAKAAKVSEGEGDVKVRGCLSTLIAHTAPVTGAGWGEEGRVWSGSWDHSVRGWDVETQSDTAVMSGGHAVTSVAVMNVGAQRGALVASGHTDRIVRVWDPRSGGAAMVSAALSSHKGWVSAVAWSGRNEYELASASLDTTVKLWDIRGAVPNHTIKAHEGKVLCVGFCRSGVDLSLVSGGEDGKMRTFALGKA